MRFSEVNRVICPTKMGISPRNPESIALLRHCGKGKQSGAKDKGDAEKKSGTHEQKRYELSFRN